MLEGSTCNRLSIQMCLHAVKLAQFDIGLMGLWGGWGWGWGWGGQLCEVLKGVLCCSINRHCSRTCAIRVSLEGWAKLMEYLNKESAGVHVRALCLCSLCYPVVTICTTRINTQNSTFCPHSVFVRLVWIWEQTAIISLYSINWLAFITETECVYCAVRSAHTVYLCVLCGSENKQRLFHYTASLEGTDCSSVSACASELRNIFTDTVNVKCFLRVMLLTLKEF
jgi:hypothetical protein